MGVEFLDEKPNSEIEFIDDPSASVKKNVIRETLIDKLANNPIINAILGAGDAAAHALSFGKLNPRNATGLSYDIGRFGGSLLPYALAELATGGAATPLVEAGVAPELAGLATRLGAGALYGAATSPENRLKGTALGVAGSGIGEAVPKTISTISKGLDIFKPQKLVKSLFDLVPAKLAEATSKSSDLYNNIFNRFGNSSIYGDITKPSDISEIQRTGFPALSYPELGSSKYLNFDKANIKKFYNSDLKKMHDLFIESPTLVNAHKLQSQLGTELRDLDVMRGRLGALPAADRTLYDTYNGARNSLKSDINDFLIKNDKNAAKDYIDANNHFISNVIPNRNLSLIINKLQPNVTSERMSNILRKAIGSNKEMPEYIHPVLDSLDRRIAYKNLGQKGAGAALGLALTHGYSLPAELTGVGLGTLLGKPVTKALNVIPLDNIYNVQSKLYKPAAKSILAGLLNMQ